VGNYGFAAPAPGCPEDEQPPHNSVSLFRPDGTPLSPSATATSGGGFTQGGISWPQGTIADEDSNVWIANCGNDTVTRFPGGDPEAAQSFDFGLEQPFDVVDNGEHIFISGLQSDNVAIVDRSGRPLPGSPVSGGGIDHPMGLATDGQGNVWVSSSGLIDLPCPDRPTNQSTPPSVVMLSPHGTPSGSSTGGGITIPWGMTTDGAGNVWVANFAGKRLSHFCGADAGACPAGVAAGEAISPDVTGYGFDGLVRNTGVIVDPSGNVWVTNNWEEVPLQTNPGGHQIVAFLGMAPPVQPPAPRDRPVDPPPSDGPVRGAPAFTG
jgi:hypothetical protein